MKPEHGFLQLLRLDQLAAWPSSTEQLHLQLTLVMLVAGLAAFVTLLTMEAPYGRCAAE